MSTFTIGPDEIDKVEEAGILNKSPVKLLRTKGGFWIAVGKPNGSRDEALAGGSHPAIVKYNLEKLYPQFQPNLMKSEGMIEPVVEQHSHFLSEDLRKSGHDIYSVQSGMKVEFHVNKLGVKIAHVDAEIDQGKLMVGKLPPMQREIGSALVGATAEKCLSAGLKKVSLR